MKTTMRKPVQLRSAQETRRLAGSPSDRLLSDLAAIGLLNAARPAAAERLSELLGDDLLAAVRAELTQAGSITGVRTRAPKVA
jgi:hypothetical protein